MDNDNRFESNLIFAKTAAIYWSRRTQLAFDDCYQLACIGLLKASRSYKVSKGAQFKTWAHTIINNEIRSELRNAQKHSTHEVLLEEKEGVLDTIEKYGYIDDNFESIEDDYENTAKRIKAVLTEREWDIVCMIMQNVDRHTIALKYNVGQPHISRIMKGIKKKVSACLAY